MHLLTLALFLITLPMVQDIPQDKDKTQALEVIFSRKSVRSYTDKPVSEEQVQTLLQAAMCAPSGMNAQPWRFVVVREQATKDKMAVGFNKMIAKAPVVIVVCGKTTNKDGRFNHNWTADCAAATENLLLAAEALGLPEDVKPLCIIPVGYPAGNDKPKDKWKPENIHYEKW